MPLSPQNPLDHDNKYCGHENIPCGRTQVSWAFLLFLALDENRSGLETSSTVNHGSKGCFMVHDVKQITVMQCNHM